MRKYLSAPRPDILLAMLHHFRPRLLILGPSGATRPPARDSHGGCTNNISKLHGPRQQLVPLPLTPRYAALVLLAPT